MVVAAGAADRQAEPHSGDGAGAVDRPFDSIHLQFESPFAVMQGVAVESRRDALIDGRSGDQVSGDLLDGESVKAQVPVEGVDHPVPPAPRIRTDEIGLVAVALSESSLVQPVQGVHFSVLRRGEQALDNAPVTVRSEAAEIGDIGRKTRQVKTQASQEDFRRGFGRGLEALAFQARGHERIDGVPAPIPVFDGRHLRAGGTNKRPMLALRGGLP